MEALHNSGSLRLKPDRGEGSFSELANFPETEVPARVHAQCWWWGRSCKSSLHMFLMYILTRSLPLHGNLNNDLGSVVQATKIERSWDCILVPCNLEIAKNVQSWDWHAVSGFWECAAQSRDTLAEKAAYAARFVALYESVDVPLEWNTGMEYWNSLNCYKILDNYSVTSLTSSSWLWSQFRHLFLEVIRVKGHVHIGQRQLWLNPGRHATGFEHPCTVPMFLMEAMHDCLEAPLLGFQLSFVIRMLCSYTGVNEYLCLATHFVEA